MTPQFPIFLNRILNYKPEEEKFCYFQVYIRNGYVDEMLDLKEVVALRDLLTQAIDDELKWKRLERER